MYKSPRHERFDCSSVIPTISKISFPSEQRWAAAIQKSRFRVLVTSGYLVSAIACGGGGAIVDSPPADAPPAPPEINPASPVKATVTTVGTSFAPATVTIAPGESVTWQISGVTHNVTFGGAKPTGGDIPDSNPGTSASRTFANAGSFPYQCTRHSGMTGTVVVTTGGVSPPPSPGAETVVKATAQGFTPERVDIAPNAVVTWEIDAGAGGIAFDNTAPPGGDVPEPSAAIRVSRTFPAAGDFDYHNTRNRNLKGRVRVR